LELEEEAVEIGGCCWSWKKKLLKLMVVVGVGRRNC